VGPAPPARHPVCIHSNRCATRPPSEEPSMNPLSGIGQQTQSTLREAGPLNGLTVQFGDTLSQLAVKVGVPLHSLMAANPHVLNPDVIYPGEQIALPHGGDTGAGHGGAGPLEGPQGDLQSGPVGPLGPVGTLAAGTGVSAAQLLQIVPQLDAGRAPAIASSLN